MRFIIFSFICLPLVVVGCFFSKSPKDPPKSNQQDSDHLSTIRGATSIQPPVNPTYTKDDIQDSTNFIKEFKSLEPTPAEAEALANHLNALKQDKDSEMEHLRAFKKLLSTDSTLARDELVKYAKIRFGNHPILDEWLGLYFRLVQDGKGPLSDHIHLLELELQMLGNKDPEKYSMEIKSLRRARKQYEVMTKMAKSEGKTPETFEMKFILKVQ
ncbi:MAG: hypothetical protein OXI24_18425 [Candidatus Poribacteria bacterium]|nr:hypothetical protein [Candidatus Poribacteria bacterium]